MFKIFQLIKEHKYVARETKPGPWCSGTLLGKTGVGESPRLVWPSEICVAKFLLRGEERKIHVRFV